MPLTTARAVRTGTRALLALLAEGTDVHDLAQPFAPGMPQSPNHPRYAHALPRRHGDMVRADGGSAASDIIVLGTHVGTHIDALAHVSQDGLLHGGLDAAAEQRGGRFLNGGVQDVAPMVCRGVLLDIPAALGLVTCAPGFQITPEHLELAVEQQGTGIEAGDVVLIRSGWGARFAEGDAFVGHASGVPGVSEAGASWLARHRVRAVGADSIAFEWLAPGAGHSALPAHRVLLVENGINIIETMMLEGIAAAGVYEFLFMLAPLPLVGATGSPVRPLAVVVR